MFFLAAAPQEVSFTLAAYKLYSVYILTYIYTSGLQTTH